MRGQADEATMRILVADQDSELLEGVARVFEVDVATNKATCVDLLRANDFDVVIASERLTDGSGLELLSQIAQRWPRALRIFAIDPARRALLRGKLGPFKLFDVLNYPFDTSQLEDVLIRAAESLGSDEEPVQNVPAPGTAPAVAPPMPPVLQAAARASAPSPRAAAQAAPARAPQPAAPPPRAARSEPPVRMGTNQFTSGRTTVPPPPARPGTAAPSMAAAARASSAPTSRPSASRSAYGSNSKPEPRAIPLPRRGSKVVPLGSPDAGGFRILPSNDYGAADAALMRRSRRDSDLEAPASGVQERAAKLASNAVAAMSSLLKGFSTSPAADDLLAPQTAPRKKR